MSDKNIDKEIEFDIEENTDSVEDKVDGFDIEENKDNVKNTDEVFEVKESKSNIDIDIKEDSVKDNVQDTKNQPTSLDSSSDDTDETSDDDIVLGEDEDFEIIEESDVTTEIIDKYRRKKRVRLAVISVIVLIVCSAGCYLFIDQRAQLDRFDASLHNSAYIEAKELYDALMDSQKSKADLMVESKVEDIYKSYYKGSLTIDKALAELDKLSKLRSGAKESINKMKELFALITESEKNYEKGKLAYEEDELKNSIIYYGKVIKKDVHYKSAQSQLKKISAEYRKKQIAVAEEFVEEEDYDSAIKVMYEYLKLLSKDKIAIQQLQKYKSDKLDLNISDIEDSVDVSVKKQDYVSAIAIVREAIDEYGDDKRLVSMLPELVENMYIQVEKYVKSDRYTSAVSMLKEYLNIVKTDEKASGLIEEYSSKVSDGVAISSIEPISQEGKCYVIEEVSDYKDANGNTYENVLEVVGYRNLETKGKIVYENKGYSTLTGSIGYTSSKDIEYYKEGSGKLFVLGDSKVIFTSDEITQDAKNQELNIDISKYKKITIEWKPTNTKNVKMYSIVLGDFMFVK